MVTIIRRDVSMPPPLPSVSVTPNRRCFFENTAAKAERNNFEVTIGGGDLPHGLGDIYRHCANNTIAGFSHSPGLHIQKEECNYLSSSVHKIIRTTTYCSRVPKIVPRHYHSGQYSPVLA